MTVRLIHGDCHAVLCALADASIDACITDPPYHLIANKKEGPRKASPDGAQRERRGFMGMQWDGGDVAFRSETWAEVLRVLKPGAHLLAFGGTRTYHRMVCAIEDAGFEIRDQIGWTFGSGFPKSRNLSGEWKGWGTALKPAWEPIVVARKPLIGTVESNVLKHGTGALNIDGCRIPTDNNLGGGAEKETTVDQKGNEGWTRPWMEDEAAREAHASRVRSNVAHAESLGRWPANIIHDGSDEVVACFPDDAGAQAPVHRRNGDKFRTAYGEFKGDVDEAGSTFQGDSGSAARFFYCAKTSRADRNDGCEAFQKRPLNWSSGDQNPGSFLADGTDRSAHNPHPTVKPTELMRYLCRLVTPPLGTILDPFMGSGSTGRGALIEGFSFIGIEKEAAYIEIARARIRAIAGIFYEEAV